MQQGTRYSVTIALIVAIGGFLMGFDAAVIAGAVGAIEVEFALTKIQLGWSVSSLTLTATVGMLFSGPLSDRVGRRVVLKIAAVLFAVSAVASALAPGFLTFVLARMIGGFGVGAALVIAPMYIAEMAPPDIRGRMVSLAQLNIVIGISAAFFSNYLILLLGQSDAAWAAALNLDECGWRWMLGVEAFPAVVYFFALLLVPESPRWLAMQARDDEAIDVLARVSSPGQAARDLREVKRAIEAESELGRARLGALFHRSMRLALTIGIAIGILQQITGINAVFFYAPMIFEQSGIGTNAAFMQATLVGLVNLLFTFVAIVFIDKLGRRRLLGFGMTGIAICMFVLSYGFSDGVEMNPMLILAAILGFVASFAMSLGPIMWVLFSELFPNRIRGVAVSFVGFVNSTVAFLVTFVFPWELATIGNSLTFLIYGLFAAGGLFFILGILPETKGRSLEELESVLAGK